MNSFRLLNNEEKEILLNAPALVMILIAGADGNIDNKEIARAISVIKENADNAKIYLREFYEKVADNFPSKFYNLLQSLPADTNQRNNFIIKYLSQINGIFKKTDKTFNIVLYASLRNIAVEIAESSGGTFGINSISPEESEFINLPMIKDPSLLFN